MEVLSGLELEDPAGLERTMDEFTDQLAGCQKLEEVAGLGADRPLTRAALGELGLTGIEFASFITTHPCGLASDLVPLHTADARTVPGQVYRVDGQSHFTQLDIGERLPVETGAVDWVYAEHLIEHVPLPVAIGWLTEVRRILTPGGLLRLSTPDLRKYMEGYVNQDKFFGKHRRRVDLAIGVAPPMPARSAFMVNQIFYHYGHRWIYDEAELRHVLGEAGFDPESMRVCSYRDGADPDVAALDQTIRNDETIYVEVGGV